MHRHRSTAGSDNKCTVDEIVSPPVLKETYLEPDIWAAGMQVCALLLLASVVIVFPESFWV